MVKPTVNSEKHLLEIGPGTVATAAILNSVILTAVAAPSGAANEVRVGCTVKAIYIELWVTSDDAAQGSSLSSLEKLNGGLGGMTFAESQALHIYPNKKQLFEIHRGLLASNVRNPTPFFAKWIAIPKGKQRMGLGDQMVLNINGIANGTNFCGLSIFKEYY